DLGFIGADSLVHRIDETLSTLDRLERYDGHFLNWYDSQSLAPLTPRYVSAVDSGNLAASLIALASGLRTLAPAASNDADLAGILELSSLLERSILQQDRTYDQHQGKHPQLRK